VLTAVSQVTIFNIPTADTQPKRTFTLEGDFISKPTSDLDGGFRSYGYRGVYGLNNKTDLGANFFYTRGAGESAGEIQFHAKRMLYRHEGRGLAVSTGFLSYFPLRSRSEVRAGAYLYVNGSKQFATVRGLRVTSGIYHIVRDGKDIGNRTGAMFGVEQPLTDRFSFIADWSTGVNRFGYAAAGLNYVITPRQYLSGGWNFGNSGRRQQLVVGVLWIHVLNSS